MVGVVSVGSRMKNVVLFYSVLFPLRVLCEKKGRLHRHYTRGNHSRSSRSTLLRSIQCLARFLVTANGYGSDTRFTTLSLQQAPAQGFGSVSLSAVCVLHFHLSLLVVFTPATKSPPLPCPSPPLLFIIIVLLKSYLICARLLFL